MKNYKWLIILGLLLVLAVPAMAALPPEQSGEIPDTGQLYGDLYVILRDVSGVPMLDDNGCIQPISSVTGSVTIETDGDPLVINVLEGEPFALPTYTLDGDLVECELTEEMATWVKGVEFGRLNMGRAPDHVLAHAFDEAINAMNDSTAIATDPSGRLVLTRTDGTIKTIDSPAENLSLYIKMMKDGHWITTDTDPISPGGPPDGMGPPEGDGPSSEPRPVLSDVAISLLPRIYQALGDETRTNEDLTKRHLLLAASLLAAAADKTGTMTLDKVVYINSIYGINQVGSLAGEVEGKTYFDFDGYFYNGRVYSRRSSGDCDLGYIWVLQPELDSSSAEVPNHFVTQCMEILGYDPDDPIPVNAVRFTLMEEAYETVFDDAGDPLEYDFLNNVRAFAKSSDDALQVIEYIHNYKVPEVLYPEP